jgi:multidrug efflux pump subunit AcrA (membrane-fusion protein)
LDSKHLWFPDRDDLNQRPQSIQSVISGRIENWYVQEGDFVNKGDTILFISEIKEDYMDPNLVANTETS